MRGDQSSWQAPGPRGSPQRPQPGEGTLAFALRGAMLRPTANVEGSLRTAAWHSGQLGFGLKGLTSSSKRWEQLAHAYS